MARLVAIIALALAPALAAGCGGTVLDSAKTEDTLAHSLESERGEKVSSVDCPSGQEVEPKATFECTIQLENGQRETATLEIRNEDADVSVISIEEEGRGANE
ncbi:MAG TPA: DUF4333 domain-containing protein [Solirubrobacterales bacterium]|nr:DUF4333 domain-containing protein [Solirubrobacterales bacterium]